MFNAVSYRLLFGTVRRVAFLCFSSARLRMIYQPQNSIAVAITGGTERLLLTSRAKPFCHSVGTGQVHISMDCCQFLRVGVHSCVFFEVGFTDR